jgi:transcriptional regulator with XRE-family HTH domain
VTSWTRSKRAVDDERPNSTVLGPKIRSLRQHLSLTLDEVATSAGMSAPFLSQIERGLARPSVATLMAIARVLGVKIQYLLDAPREERYVARGDQLTFFGFAGADNGFARLTQVTEGVSRRCSYESRRGSSSRKSRHAPESISGMCCRAR